MMTFKQQSFSIIFFCLCVCGCNSIRLTQADRQELQEFKESASPEDIQKLRTNQNFKIWETVLFNDPKVEAKKSALNNDYGLLGIAAGYHAEPDDAEPLGLSCNDDAPIKINALTFGCIGAPDFMYKLAWQYNVELYNQKNSALKKYCTLKPIP